MLLKAVFVRVAIRSSILLAALAAAALFGAACKSSTAPAPPNCSLSLNLDSGTMGSAGGNGTVSVTTQAGCGWTATTDVGWITNLSPTTGSGPGQVSFQAGANSAITSRSGQITLNGVSVRVTQSGTQCEFNITPQSQPFPASGGSGSVVVGSAPGCTWSATSSDGWLTVISGASGSGDGIVRFTVQPNSGLARIATIAIGDQSAVVTQQASGSTQCTYGIQPSAASIAAGGGTATVTITAGVGCSWTAASNASWLTISGASTGIGNGAVTLNAGANNGISRSTTITVAGLTVIVTQAGACSASISPASQSIGSGGGAGTAIAVTTSGSCAWTATTNDSWISIGSPAGGTGNGTVNFSVAANAGVARTGFITISDQTFTVNQAGSCPVSLNPASQSLPAAAGAGAPIAVTATVGCVWTATTSDSWITITGNAGGSGNGTVNFAVAENTTGAARVGTISIGNSTHTVTQAATEAASTAIEAWLRNVAFDNPLRR